MSVTTAPSNASVDLSAVQAARSIRRLVNRSIYDKAVELRVADDVPLEFVCECGDLRCTALVNITLPEFDRLARPGVVTAHS